METKVLYNASCPICSREIHAYRRYSEARDLPLRFSDLGEAELSAYGLTEEMAARRLHVVQNGEVLAGVPAFVALWAAMPRFRWLARAVSLPVVRPIAEIVYERVLAPVLFGMHRRRQLRLQRASSAPADAE